MYLGPPCYGYAIKCHLVCLALPGTRLLGMKKQNSFVLIICNRKKGKFKSVQINMKHVLYIDSVLLKMVYHVNNKSSYVF